MSILGSEIDDLKGVFSKRQGAAMTNRFMLFMQPPKASLINLDVNAAITGAISGNLNLGAFINDPRDVSLLCESCTLPGRSVTTMELQNVKQSIKVPYSFVNEDVTFTFLLTGDYYMRKMFDNWMNLVFNTESYELQFRDKYVSDVRIAQLNKDNVPIYTVKLEHAYPTAINAISLDNTAENGLQKVTVNMTYENFKVESLAESIGGVASAVGGTISNTIGTIKGVF